MKNVNKPVEAKPGTCKNFVCEKRKFYEKNLYSTRRLYARKILYPKIF